GWPHTPGPASGPGNRPGSLGLLLVVAHPGEPVGVVHGDEPLGAVLAQVVHLGPVRQPGAVDLVLADRSGAAGGEPVAAERRALLHPAGLAPRPHLLLGLTAEGNAVQARAVGRPTDHIDALVGGG